MGEIKAVSEAVGDPKAGRPKPTSDTQFPYYDLADAVEIAKAVHQRAGGECDRAQLATLLGHKGVRSGAFLSRVSAVKMYGLVDQGDDGKIRLTERGKAIVAPVTQQARGKALLDAFMDVELFRKVYERFEGHTLPAEVGLKNLLETTYGIVSSRVGPTVRIMLDSADLAGLFQASGNRTRMVKPLGAHTVADPPKDPPQDPPRTNGDPQDGAGGRHGGGGGGGGLPPDTTIDPAILGLLQRLPPGGTPMSAKRRKALVDAFTATVDFIYPEDGEE